MEGGSFERACGEPPGPRIPRHPHGVQVPSGAWPWPDTQGGICSWWTSRRPIPGRRWPSCARGSRGHRTRWRTAVRALCMVVDPTAPGSRRGSHRVSDSRRQRLGPGESARHRAEGQSRTELISCARTSWPRWRRPRGGGCRVRLALISDEQWGLLDGVVAPGYGELGLYEPATRARSPSLRLAAAVTDPVAAPTSRTGCRRDRPPMRSARAPTPPARRSPRLRRAQLGQQRVQIGDGGSSP